MRLLLSILLPLLAAAFECDWTGETCPWARDGQCDVDFGCTQDCWDCDPMQEYRYNCEGCVENGGYWCPGDALCLSTPVTANEFATHINYEGNPFINSCPTVSDWQQDCEPLSPDNVFKDPMYDAMAWAFKLINVEEVWRQGFTGKGIHVRVTDDGVDGDHPEFSNRFDKENSCPNYLKGVEENHGTNVASLLAAEADNGVCSVGIAPGVTLSACSMLFGVDQYEDKEGAAMLYNIEVVDVSHNSWGPLPCAPNLLMEGDDDSIGDDDEWLGSTWDDDAGWLRDDDSAMDDDSSKNPFGDDVFRNRRRNRRSRRRLHHRRLECMFTYDHADSPCKVCGDTMDLANQTCQESIAFHCYFYYDLDEAACVEYLDLFVDCEYHTLELPLQNAFAKAVTEGRDGKGVVFVFPAGNEKTFGSNANVDGIINSRLTISVGAVDKLGKRTGYTTPGAPVFVAAPGGDEEYVSNQITAGFGGDCLEAGVGTSFSAPTLSGVVALMLEANGNLTWRDVQGVIAATSQYNDPDEPSWTTNAAGYHHNYYYGFGLVDAAKAVATAQTWINWGPEQQILAESGTLGLPITDDPDNITSSTILMEKADGKEIVLESVVAYIDLEHGSRGDLTITLTSPSGTESLLVPGKRPENSQLPEDVYWKLMTVRNWGESPYGNWTLEIKDERKGVYSECVDLPFEYQGTNETMDDDDSLSDFDGNGNGDNRKKTRNLNMEGGGVFQWELWDWNCDYVVSDGMCADGMVEYDEAYDVQVVGEDGKNISAVEACCGCGGGLPASDIPHVLTSWRLLAYGHDVSITAEVGKSGSGRK